MSHHTRHGRRAVGVITVTAFVLVGLLQAGAGAQSESVPGITSTSVKFGFVFSQTGVASSSFRNTGKACEARIARANRAGGVNGRKIEVVFKDDQTSGANLTAVQDLVLNQHVFAVINDSPVALLSYRYLLSQGVPVIGGGFDGTYYGVKGNENVLSAYGNSAPFNGLTYDIYARVMKKLGATKVAALAYGISPSSTAGARSLQQYGVPALGMQAVYTNTAVDAGTADVGPFVLGIKNAGADAVFLPLVTETNIAVIKGLRENGIEPKAVVLGTGYGQDLLDSPVASIFKPSDLLYQIFKPVELQDPATKQFQADRKKVGLTGVPDYGQYMGYIACDMAVTALQHAGKSPTRQGFIDGFRKLGTYDQAGLGCKPIAVGLDTFGKLSSTSCGYFVQLKKGKFVVMNHGKPFVGKLVGSPDALRANAAGNPLLLETTTTTAAPGH